MMGNILNRIATKGSVAVLAALLLHACAPIEGAEKAADAGARKAVEDKAASVSARNEKPEGAVLIEGDLYAVPMAVDKDGCEQFRAWSGTGAIPLGQPIYYHDGEGSFSPTRLDDVSCNAEMVEAGTDAEGCPTYRARQPNGSTTGAQYFQSASGFTTSRERSVCE